MHFPSNMCEFNADFFPILEISPKKFIAHLKLNLLCSRMNAKDFLRSAGNALLRHKLLLLENCLLHSSAKSANIYSAAATSTRNAFHYTVVVAWRRSDIFKAEYCSSIVQQSLVIKILNADLQLQADFAISHSYNTNADYSPHSDCSVAQSRN